MDKIVGTTLESSRAGVARRCTHSFIHQKSTTALLRRSVACKFSLTTLVASRHADRTRRRSCVCGQPAFIGIGVPALLRHHSRHGRNGCSACSPSAPRANHRRLLPDPRRRRCAGAAVRPGLPASPCCCFIRVVFPARICPRPGRFLTLTAGLQPVAARRAAPSGRPGSIALAVPMTQTREPGWQVALFHRLHRPLHHPTSGLLSAVLTLVGNLPPAAPAGAECRAGRSIMTIWKNHQARRTGTRTTLSWRRPTR